MRLGIRHNLVDVQHFSRILDENLSLTLVRLPGQYNPRRSIVLELLCAAWADPKRDKRKRIIAREAGAEHLFQAV